MTRLLLVLICWTGCYTMSSWPLLKVKFGGFDCHSTHGFYDMPRTEREAIAAGFTKLSDCVGQGEPTANWAGKRYTNVADEGVVLIYNNAGDIAGIQSGISNDYWHPTPSLQDHPFVTYQNKHYITFYFEDPSAICSTAQSSYSSTARLYIQNGTSPTNVEEVPLLESQLQGASWYPHACIPVMGQHYRHNVRNTTRCDAISPVFTMYNGGNLDGFGWTILGNVNSSHFEHPPVVPSPNTPTCLYSYEGGLTGLHVYLTSPCNRHC